MSHQLTQHQLFLLARVRSAPLVPATLRVHSELRWLEHLGLVAFDGKGHVVITAQGLARLGGAADQQLNS